MASPAPTGVWTCGRCGRRVPLSLTLCRCGFPKGSSREEVQTPRGGRATVWLGVGLALAAAIVLAFLSNSPRIETSPSSIESPPLTAPREETAKGPLEPPEMRSPVVTVVGGAEEPADGAAEEYEAKVARVARAADGVDRSWERYRASCLPYSSGETFGREWFGVWSASFDEASQPLPECGALLAGVLTEAESVRTGMEEAAGARPDPGAALDIRRKYRMDWSGWRRD